ncbi:hypothetical protein [Caenimonas soli]|uniref:hypothetical protein n=1 Tax=Caenimonas soli TaxID=2735555 RepID=UPI001554EB7E|nr:hypothetical protein [Caenimonas soli]NPC58687.1 hypothetical protein [Caenimonas soli]
MAYSSIYGADVAPVQPSGRDAELLGPSDSSDTGSDALGTNEAYGDSDASGTGERGSVTPGEAREGADILPDRVVRLGDGGGFSEDDPDAQEFTDLDASEPGDDEEG